MIVSILQKDSVLCDRAVTQDVLATLQAQKYGEDAAIVGHVTEDNLGMVQMQTSLGGTLLVDWFNSESWPRIC